MRLRGAGAFGAGVVYLPSCWPFHAADRLQAPQVDGGQVGAGSEDDPLVPAPEPGVILDQEPDAAEGDVALLGRAQVTLSIESSVMARRLEVVVAVAVIAMSFGQVSWAYPLVCSRNSTAVDSTSNTRSVPLASPAVDRRR